MSDPEFDDVPILIIPRAAEVMDEVLEEHGSVSVDDPEHIEVEEPVDAFIPVIHRVLQSVSPAVRAAIASTPCFARLWHSAADGSYCPETECHLRGLCESAYHQAAGFEPKEEVAPVAPVAPQQPKPAPQAPPPVPVPVKSDLTQTVKKRSLQRRGQKLKVLPKREPAFPYIDQGRPVDQLAKILWEQLGQPPQLQPQWRYGACRTEAERRTARGYFVSQHGDGLWVTRRSSYHQYLYGGIHICRLWVLVASVGWLDCCPELAQVLGVRGYALYRVPSKGRKGQHQFYEYKIKIRSEIDAEGVASVIKSVLDKVEVR